MSVSLLCSWQECIAAAALTPLPPLLSALLLCAGLRQVAEETLQTLSSPELRGRPVYVNYYSNGGCFVHEQLLRLHADEQKGPALSGNSTEPAAFARGTGAAGTAATVDTGAEPRRATAPPSQGSSLGQGLESRSYGRSTGSLFDGVNFKGFVYDSAPAWLTPHSGAKALTEGMKNKVLKQAAYWTCRTGFAAMGTLLVGQGRNEV